MQLSIVPVGTVPNALLNYLKYSLPTYLKFEKISREREMSLPSSYDALRKQYLVQNFFTTALEEHVEHALLLADVDLFMEPLEYMFGHYNDNKALVSMRRLNPSFMGGNDPESLRNRVLNESIHQLGHTLGLGHCKKQCVMKLAPGVLDVDKRSVKYCPSCLKIVKKSLKAK